MMKFLNRFNKDSFLLPLSIVVSIIVRNVWFFSTGYISKGDWQHQNIENLFQHFPNPSIWQTGGIGSITATPYAIPIRMMMGFLANNGIGFEISSRLIFLWVIAILSPVSIYVLTKKFYSSPIGSFIATLVFSYNTFFLIRSNSGLTLAVAEILLTFSVFFLIDFLQKKSIRSFIYFLLTSCLMSVYDVRYMYILTFVSFIYLVIFHTQQRDKQKSLVFISVSGALFTLGYLLLNFFWILPTFFSNAIASNEMIRNSLFGNRFLDLNYALSLYHPFWSGMNGVTTFQNNAIPIYYYLIPILVVASILINQKNKKIIFPAIIGMIGILLTKQVDKPFPHLYQWLFDNMPGFRVFREASKFAILIAIGYSILIGYLFAVKAKNRNSKIFQYVSGLIVIVITIVNVLPILSSRLNTLEVPRQIHPEYQDLSELVKDSDSFGRTLYVPGSSPWGYSSSTQSKLGLASLLTRLQDNGVYSPPIEKTSRTQKLLDFINSQEFISSLQNLSFQHVVIPLNDPDNENDYFEDVEYIGKSREETRMDYESALDKVEGLEKISGFDNLVVYQVKDFSGRFWIPNNVLHLSHQIDESFLNQNPFYSANYDSYIIDESNPENSSYPFADPNSFRFYKTLLISNYEYGPEYKISNSQEVILHTETIDNVRYLSISPALYFLHTENNKLTNSNIKVATLDDNPVTISLDDKFYKLNDKGMFLNISDFENLKVSNPFGEVQDFVIDEIKDSIDFGNSDYFINSQNLFFKFPQYFDFENIIDNGDFADGLWHEKVKNCHNFDDNGDVDMRLEDGALLLESSNHIACSTKEFSVNSGGEYLLKFDTKASEGQLYGYTIHFADDGKKFSQTIKLQNDDWNQYSEVITVPRNVDTAYITVYGYSDNTDKKLKTYYDNISLIEIPNISNVITHNLNSPQSGGYTISYQMNHPTKYDISIKKSNKKPFYLNFRDKYDPNWQLVGNSNLQVSDNVRMNQMTNSWLIDPQEDCGKTIECITNFDGTIQINLQTRLHTQKLFNSGFTVSGLTLISILSFLVYDIWRNHRIQIREIIIVEKQPQEEPVESLKTLVSHLSKSLDDFIKIAKPKAVQLKDRVYKNIQEKYSRLTKKTRK